MASQSCKQFKSGINSILLTRRSLSEYGCLTNGRDFGEIKALMSKEMTGVYSGGLMYEYTNEENKYGIVQLSDAVNSANVQELGGFAKFAKALASFPQPAGDGGAASTTHAVPCPTKGLHWQVEGTLLPAIPEEAKRFFKEGAGQGPGLKGVGSQNAGGGSTADAKPGSGTVTETASTSKNAAGVTFGGPVDKTPFVVAAVTLALTMTGTLLL